MAADVATSLKDVSTTAASNQPDGTDVITAWAENMRTIQAVFRQPWSRDTIASASTCDIGAKDAGSLDVTGTTTITSFGTVSAGIRKWLTFAGALTLTHNDPSLYLPTGANITTAAGDTALFESTGSGNWKCLSYSRADGSVLSNTSVLPDGSAGTPALRFTLDTDTGLYRSTTNTLGVAAGGAEVVTFSSAGVVYGGSTSGSGFSTSISGNYSRLEYDTTVGNRLKIYNAGAGGIAGPFIFVDLPNASGTNDVIRFTNSGGNSWRVNVNGATFADGAYSGSGADYAEAFLYVGDRPEPGDTVTLEGDKVRKAIEGDDIIGAVSDKACAIGDAKLLEAGGVPVGLVGKLRVNEGCPVDPSWRLLRDNLYLVR